MDQLDDSVGVDFAEWMRRMPSDVDTDVEAARQRIGRLSRLFARVLTTVAERFHMSVGDWEALSALQRNGPELTPKQLSDTLGLTAGTITVRIDRLMQAGFIEHSAGVDGRSRPVRLTTEGRRCWRAATKQRAVMEKRLFAKVFTKEDLDLLNPLLARILRRFEDEYGHAGLHDVLRGE